MKQISRSFEWTDQNFYILFCSFFISTNVCGGKNIAFKKNGALMDWNAISMGIFFIPREWTKSRQMKYYSEGVFFNYVDDEWLNLVQTKGLVKIYQILGQVLGIFHRQISFSPVFLSMRIVFALWFLTWKKCLPL